MAGAPTRIFQDERIDGERFHLLTIDDPTLEAVYVDAEIPGGAYPFQAEPVDVVAVKAVLMTYDYQANRNAYHRTSCDAVAGISNLILTRFGELQENGHPKWKNVDLNDIPPGWEVSDCVNRGLSETYRLNCGAGTDAPATSTLESEANDAYRQRICAAIGC